MDIVGDRRFVEIPGSRLHELPPLLVRGNPAVRRLDRVMNMASDIVQSEDLLAESTLEGLADELEVQRRKMDLAINLVEQYLAFVSHWQWGDGILEWIRQCETTFQFSSDLRPVLRPDVWPHASRCSFVTLLNDKAVKVDGVDLERAVGMRLTFRQPPPIACFSNQFLFYLNSSVANSAYQTWSQMAPDPVSSLPPERFTFQIVNM
ncbi:MAG: hypothetical protein H7039_24560 [Bryobacteraceae bacterium]|nr:hypothetical protein [Bryobacteraceae bacterium]